MKLVQVELCKIIIDEKRQDQVIVLKEKDGDRQFPIVIGFLEASSIKMKLANVVPPRPMTHDLLVSVIESLGVDLERLVIDKMVKNTFHGKLKFILPDGSERIVDTRPSDGIAIAVRMGIDIYVAEEIINKTALF
ncbi:MAG: bifunctional nuclease family protein [Candidatus Omnitrophica bacterium]|nr:bifunctional nuclease family protein [Candidatus Omnitrophota bacterium]